MSTRGPSMSWFRKKLPNPEQCWRSRKYTSNYWVISSRVVFEFFLPAKVERWCPRVCFFFFFQCQNGKKIANNAIALEEITQPKVVSVVSKVHIQQLVVSSWVVLEFFFLPAKVEQYCPRVRFLVPSQNAENGATDAMVLKETSQHWKVLEVSIVHIQLLGGLVSSSVTVLFCPQKPNGDVQGSPFYFHPKTSKRWPLMSWLGKKLRNPEQCRKSRNFTSCYWWSRLE